MLVSERIDRSLSIGLFFVYKPRPVLVRQMNSRESVSLRVLSSFSLYRSSGPLHPRA